MEIQGAHPPKATFTPQEIAGLNSRPFFSGMMVVNNPLIRPAISWGKRGIGGWAPWISKTNAWWFTNDIMTSADLDR